MHLATAERQAKLEALRVAEGFDSIDDKGSGDKRGVNHKMRSKKKTYLNKEVA